MKHCILYVVRHGQSIHNRDYITSGHVDPQLTELGVVQANEAKERLANIVFDEVYSSDLERAIQTAEIITGNPVPITHRLTALRERSFGDFDGKSETLLDERADSVRSTFNALPDEDQWRFKWSPDVESDDELSQRIIGALEKIAVENAGKTILVASHGGALRTLLIKLQRLSTNSLPRGTISNTGFVELTYDGNILEVLQIEGAKTSRSASSG
jgi:broad specificity phosphatase PhoE